jgi:hypothetical protein
MPRLDWLTRPEDARIAASAPYRLLEAVPELPYGDGQPENMLIQGHNLEALKAANRLPKSGAVRAKKLLLIRFMSPNNSWTRTRLALAPEGSNASPPAK